MTDRVYPSSKPATNGTATAAAANNAAAPSAAAKQPQLRHPYRPQPQYHSHRRRRSRRNLCCCCCFWSLLLLLALGLLAAIAGAALYVLYRPQRPQFWVSSLRIAKLNLTTAADSSSSHLTSLLNLTLSSKNPNSHITFFYDPFTLSCLSSGSVQIANGSIPAFTSDKKNETSFRAILTASTDLDTESVTSLRSDLKRKSGVPMKIQMDTKVKVKLGGVRSKKVGIRVSCQGITGVAPKSKSPSVASVSGSKCKVDLRIKIWKFTF
ncbi:NDR1/HIN1-like protein 13 [Alnus glutinosa]|uniref:NDR1/HIN1-like protein 13 n=1 Tax=Alnus glutinosa TaxID=3517 RepID=UPI002D768331|nr:NDR1/HIN1-like protein 13 [Alnus glutinosa]